MFKCDVVGLGKTFFIFCGCYIYNVEVVEVLHSSSPLLVYTLYYLEYEYKVNENVHSPGRAAKKQGPEALTLPSLDTSRILQLLDS